jgi:hypothetical protein
MERRSYWSVRLWSLVLTSLLIPIGCGESAQSSGNPGKGGSNGGAGGKGSAGAGGTSASGGSGAGGSKGGASGSGGKSSAGGDAGTAGGGTPGSGGSAAGAGGKGAGGTTGGSGHGGDAGGGGSPGTGGSAGAGGGSGGKASGGTTGGGGKGGAAGATGAGGGGSVSADCTITISSGDVSPKMATVGVVEWSTDLANVASAQIVYTLNNAASSILNKGGTAPVDLKRTNYRTLLLGLKPSSTYTFHVEATTSSGSVCKSADRTLTTGTLSGAPTITRTATNPTSQAGGFIVTSTGQAGGGGFSGGGAGGSGAFIIDADGTVVWYAAAPSQCSRAHMDYEGANMWMLALNVQNSGGEMRFVSMDGATSKTSISGFSGAHHDFTVLPGKIAAMVWASSGTDPESNLVEMASDGSGSATTVFKIGSNLYAGGASLFGGGGSGSNSYHCNYIIYHPADDSFTISDRNPNLVVKVKHDGTPIWQIGGSCTNAKAPKCASGTWQVNHGHDFDSNGNMMVFNNGQTGASHVLDLKVSETTSAISYTTNKDFTSSNNSNVMGDVQYLPNGNRLIAYSSASVILEVDASWNTIQTLKGAGGYADWRQTLYGPPTRK